tara:strand:- start:381 stop:845 length:465 start_codon:yes stop_codon:yes gene_type:complete
MFRLFLFFLMILPSLALANTDNYKHLENLDAPSAHLDDFYDEMSILRVIDGDTFITDKDRIRLWGINAPEKNQPYYDVATFALTKFLKTKVKCKHIDIDKYQRNIMQCMSLDGQDIGAMMVWTGMARDFSKYSGGYYSSEEQWAKKNRLGIWSE